MNHLPGFEPDWATLPAACRQRIGSWVTDRGDSTPRQAGRGLKGFNLAMHVNDDPVAVQQRRIFLSEHIGVSPLWLNQTHSVTCIDGSATFNAQVPDADGSVVSTLGAAAVVMTADCLPVLFAADNAQAVGAAHAGWRGLLNGVLENCLEAVARKAQVNPSNVHVYLGPAIGPLSFEVGQDVKDAFIARNTDAGRAFQPFGQPHKYLADLYELATLRLRACGVHHFNGGGFDTLTQDRWFSHRYCNTSGRMASLVWLRA